MKTDRFSSALTRAAAVLLAGLLLAHLPAAGGSVKVTYESASEQLARMLALEVGAVQERFGESRRALRPVQGADGKPAYLRQEVASLVTRTGEDLDAAMEAIEKAQTSDLEPLRAWAAEELGLIQGALAAPAGQTASYPRAVAMIASLGDLKLASAKKAAPRQDTLDAGKTEGLLDQVGEVIGRIFFLAGQNDLEVDLWVGSTPAPQATFRFWPQGRVKGSAPAPRILRTNGKPDRVLRGLYSYRASWTKGAVTELVEYPSLAAAAASRSGGERLDLVKRSGFFCCRFKDQYCHHVETQEDCR